MACMLNLFVLSLTCLATQTGGSKQFDILDKKINAIKDMMEVEIEMIKQDLSMVVKNLSMSVICGVQGNNGNVNTRKIASTTVEDSKNKIQAVEDVYKVMQRGFSSEKMSLMKSVSRIEQSVVHVQRQLENFNGQFLSKFQLLNAEINKNKNDIEAKVEKAKNDAILKSNEDFKASNIKFNGDLNSLQTNFTKIVNEVKKDVADTNRSVMNKSETLAKFQLLSTEINRNKNDIEAKVVKAKQDAILKSNADCKISIISTSFTPYKYSNSIYFKLDGAMTYIEGSRRCKQYGAHLPEVTTSGENAFLVSKFVASSDARIFFGATDQLTEGHWVWENTGQAVGFQDWYTGEPNDSNGGEDCLEIFRWKWNDIKCTDKSGIVCEFDI